jgi:lipid-A-disaccharide synthase
LRRGVGISKPFADAGARKRVLIVAGEASADLHGANLVRALQDLDATVEFWGIGGAAMEAAGVKILIPSADMAVVGLTEVFAKLRTIVKAHTRLKSILRHHRPDLLILIDYPDFNIHLARTAKRSNVPVLYYISPQVWAWRRGRIKKIARRVDRMAVILPFEKDLYQNTSLQVEYVGHPLLDIEPPKLDQGAAIREVGLAGGRPILGLLPGSRKEEIENLLPAMVGAAETLAERYPSLRCILPRALTIAPDLIEPLIRDSTAAITVFGGDIYRTLALCDVALVASGTATLETAIMGVPMVIAYRISPVSFRLAKMVVRVPFIGLVNLVAGEEIVPELIQGEVRPERLAAEAIDILENDSKRHAMKAKLAGVRDRLGRGGASKRTARIALEMMTKQVV